ncbi:MAG: UDP-N-acetylmuramoyl-tripeptide--D-alanyl-D-alanine ligase [Legionellales bacterium]|nr:UDP-N-acetylmuramoyl-tripeptide--D-alanyl-D-alanine ligase [Legionellales bacterium]
MKLTDIAKILPINQDLPDLQINNFQIDSRLIQNGDIFISIENIRDGHDFIEHASKNGAIAAIVSKPIQNPSLPILKVPDTISALTKIAKYCRQNFNGFLIAVTGSVGKTTVKEMIKNILSQENKTLYSPKSFNNHLGVPLTLCMLNNNYKFAVIELGANHLGEIENLTKLASPNIAIINHISEAHIEKFGSFNNIITAKTEIFSGVQSNGTAIFKQQSSEITSKIKQATSHLKTISFGLTNGEIFAENINTSRDNSSFTASIFGKKINNIKLNIPGKHNIENALAAISATYNLVPPKNIIKGLASLLSIPGRLNPIQLSSSIKLFDDTYNASPSSVASAIQHLSIQPGEKILVLGEMSELGDRSEYHHSQMGILAKSLGINKVYTFGNSAKIMGSKFGKNSRHFCSQASLEKFLITHLKDNTCILIKGSRKTKMENLIPPLIKHFS